MNFQTYINGILTFKRSDRKWNYSPIRCENRLCCGDEIDGLENENHGIVRPYPGAQWESIIICNDCAYQIENKTYLMKMRIF